MNNDVDRDLGFDVKYGLTQNLTADFTYNTDFAQVEVDEQQVNLTRFPLFFPEKREFFLEGQGIFDFGGADSTARSGSTLTPLLFFSRRIGLNNGSEVPIDAGGRLTGKVGKTTIGAIDVRAGDTTLTPTTNFAVLRMKQDVGRRSNVGLLYTGRSNAVAGPDASQAYGVDATLGFYDNWTINTYWARSATPGVDGRDTSYRANVLYNGDRYGLQYQKLRVDDRFNPEVGFLRRSAFDRQFGSLRFSPRPRRSRLIRKHSYSVNYDYIANTGGRLESRDVNAAYRHHVPERRRLQRAGRPQLRVPACSLCHRTRRPAAGRRLRIRRRNGGLGAGEPAQDLGHGVADARLVLQRLPDDGQLQQRTHRAVAPRLPRTGRVDQLGGSRAGRFHDASGVGPRDVHGDTAHVLQWSRAVQLQQQGGELEPAPALGIQPGQRDLRRLHRRTRHRAGRHSRLEESRVRREGEPSLPVLTVVAMRVRH
ncbi:MAG: DUF5916 domain-containing protein [Vicinamibacterales bacterium]